LCLGQINLGAYDYTMKRLWCLAFSGTSTKIFHDQRQGCMQPQICKVSENAAKAGLEVPVP
jgi:hypothetical protein